MEEWSQKQKRPRPYYNRANNYGAHKSERGTSGGGVVGATGLTGTGNVRVWLTLPHPKNDSLSYKFLTDQGFATSLEAEHAAALLALHYLNPGLPHERLLPEPYRTMWLQLVGREDSAPGGAGGGEEEGGVGKKGKKMAAWRVAEEEAKALKAAEALKREQEELEVCVLSCLSMHLFVCLCVFVSMCLCVRLSACLLVCLSVYMTICVSIGLHVSSPILCVLCNAVACWFAI